MPIAPRKQIQLSRQCIEGNRLPGRSDAKISRVNAAKTPLPSTTGRSIRVGSAMKNSMQMNLAMISPASTRLQCARLSREITMKPTAHCR